MTENSYTSKIRDAFWALSHRKGIPASLPDDLIRLYINQEPPPQIANERGLTPREWAIAVARNAAQMYNITWEPAEE